MPEFQALSRRTVLALAVTMAGGIASPTSASCRPVRVLFICQFGSVKSAVARELMKQRAAERGIAIDVRSRGITPREHVSPALATALRAEGVDTHAQPLTALAPEDVKAATVVVEFEPPSAAGRSSNAVNWSDLPSFNTDYARARPLLVARIDRLLSELPRRC